MSLSSVAEPGINPTAAAGAAIDRLFHAMCQLGASDLHLCVGYAGARPQGRPHAAARSGDAGTDG